MNSLAPRFALRRIGVGGLLLDVVAGTLFELNEVAALVWERHLGGAGNDDIAAGLVDRYGIPPEAAQRDVGETLAASTHGGAPSVAGDFSYDRTRDAFVFSAQGKPVLKVDDRGQHLFVEATALSIERLRHYVIAIAPKLLTLRGQIVLHAAAVATGGGVVAVSGISGAGKTTSIRALVRAGAQLVSEDKLLLIVRPDRTEVVLKGEPEIDAWADLIASELKHAGQVPLLSLDSVTSGPRLPLAEIGFIEANRRIGSSIVAEPLPPVQIAGSVFRSGFHGSDEPEYWRQQLDAAAHVGGTVAAFNLTMPNGVALLDAASVRVVSAGTLRS